MQDNTLTYEDVRKKYQRALKFRELIQLNEFKELKKHLDEIALSRLLNRCLVGVESGWLDVFRIAQNEVDLIDVYKELLDFKAKEVNNEL